MDRQRFRHPAAGATRAIEDHHAHLLRLDYLDRCLFFSVGNDDRAVDAHCLRLLSAQAILIGAYDNGRHARQHRDRSRSRRPRAAKRRSLPNTIISPDELADAMMARAQDEAGKQRHRATSTSSA